MSVPARIEDATTLEQVKEHVKLISNTELVPAAYRNRPHAVLAAIYYGREIGLAPMEALHDIYIPIDKEGKPRGRPELYASAMVKLARRAGHSITGQVDAKKATVRGKRADNGDEMTVTFTLDQAQTMGLIRTGSPWEKTPEDMLWAKAVSRLCRRLFPDVLGSMPYAPEDMLETTEGRIAGALAELPENDRVIEEDAGEPDFTDYDPPPASDETDEVAFEDAKAKR